LKALTGWKDIARYLGRGVRTLQPWEAIGLPIHRHGNSIIAIREEVVALVKSGSSRYIEVVTLTTRVAELEGEVERLKATIAKEHGNVPMNVDNYRFAGSMNQLQQKWESHYDPLFWSD
jgi:hypothetical protein